MTDLSPDALKRLRAIAEAATPGPWSRDTFGCVSASRRNRTIAMPGNGFRASAQDDTDARFIATFDPPTVLALLAEVERLRQQMKDAAMSLRSAPFASRVDQLAIADYLKPHRNPQLPQEPPSHG